MLTLPEAILPVLIPFATLLPPATPGTGPAGLVDHHLDLGGAPGRANRGDKMLTLVASASWRRLHRTPIRCVVGGTAGVLGCAVGATTLGTWQLSAP